MSNILKFDRSRLKAKQPRITVAYKNLKFDKDLKSALQFLDSEVCENPGRELLGLIGEIQEQLIQYNVLDRELDFNEDNVYGLQQCSYCSKFGDKIDLDDCCDEAESGGFD